MREIEIILSDRGDASVGIDGFRERVRVTFLDRDESIDEDEIDALKDCLASFLDCAAQTAAEEARDCEADRRVDNASFVVWQRDEFFQRFGENDDTIKFADRVIGREDLK